MNIMDNMLLLINIMKEILIGDNNISMFLITIIAGLFGFIIASIPLTIQLLEIKNNDKIDLINSNPIMKQKIFDRYIKLIQASFYLFLFILFSELIEIIFLPKNLIIFLPKNLIIVLLFSIYTYFVFNFIRQLYKLINILKELILIYTQ